LYRFSELVYVKALLKILEEWEWPKVQLHPFFIEKSPIESDNSYIEFCEIIECMNFIDSRHIVSSSSCPVDHRPPFELIFWIKRSFA
jgi:hypothetical protein